MLNEYWASKPKDDLAKSVMDKVTNYREYLESSGILSELRKSYGSYYGETSIMNVDQSLKAIHINHYANLIRHIHVMVTATRPAWEARSVNTDSASNGETQLANGLLEFYMREKRLENVFNEATERCLFLREGWVSLSWDVTGGESYGVNPESGKPIKEGDIECRVHGISDIIRDPYRKDLNHNWFIIRTFENKYDLAAKYPEFAQKITGLTADFKDELKYDICPIDSKDKHDTDDIPVYEFRHKKTPAVPMGRLSRVLAADLCLFDGPLPYKDIYVFPMTSAKAFERAFGHSQAMDLLPVQDAFDMCVSSILTNQAANAVQNFMVPKGAAPTITKIEDGMNLWEYDAKAGPIQSMDLLKTAPEVFKFAEFLGGQSELISGVNQIARGNAPASLSGAAMALIQQQALQYSSGVQVSLNMLSECVGSGIIELLKTFAVVPRIAMIAGKSKRSMMKEFKGKDLQNISRVFVDSANPLTKTTAGRVEIANNLLNASFNPDGMIKTPEQYISVLTTGNLEPLTEHENSANTLIRSENEWLMEGKPVQAIITDNHALHVLEHATVLNSPESRENPNMTQVVLTHIQQHIDLAAQMNPVMAAMTKQQSFAQAPPPMDQGPQGEPPTQGQNQVMSSENPISQQAEAVALPQPAISPLQGA